MHNSAKSTMSGSVKPYAAVAPHLWMGDKRVAEDMDALGDLDITAMINLTGSDDTPIEDVDIYNSLVDDLELMDDELMIVQARLNKLSDVIRDAVKCGRNVMIHDGDECVNSAPMLAAYYLVRHCSVEPVRAMNIVRTANESRDLAERVKVIHTDDDGHEHTSIECAHVKTFTNRSFRRAVYAAK